MKQPNMKPQKSSLREWLESLLWALALVAIFYALFSNTQVYSYSMKPTLLEGDHLLIWRHGTLSRGDIVTFRTNQPITEAERALLGPIQRIFSMFSNKKTLVKRIIGLPGETIEVREGKVFIDGQVLEENYVPEEGTLGDFYLEIPEGMYVLLGDNRQNSLDSRHPQIGPVPKGDIIGKALLRYWPFSKIQIF